MQRKTANCIECNQLRQIYAKSLCCWCYDKQRKKTPLKRPTKPIRKESKKRKKERPIYNRLAKEHKNENPYCQARLDGCTHIASETHHMGGRGKLYLDKSKYLSLCHNCHRIITEDSALALSRGFSISRLKN